MIHVLWRQLPLLILFLFIVSGCAKKDAEYEHVSTSLKPEGYMVEGTRKAEKQDSDNFAEGAVESLDRTGKNPLSGDTLTDQYKETYGRSTAPLRPVYFDFDSSAINVDQLEHLNNSGAYLKEKSSLNLVIEGNCDERGTADYNLALGELRAHNVKKYLVNLGMDKGRISTISYGSQRPLFPGSDEASWAKNRRADLVVP